MRAVTFCVLTGLLAACSQPEQEQQTETAEGYATRIADRTATQTEERRGPPPASIPAKNPGAALKDSGLSFYPGKVIELDSIPSGFTGAWDYHDGNCAGSSDLRFSVSGSRIAFYESTGVTQSVRQVAPDAIIVTLAMSGEGETWTETTRFTLDPGGQTMTRTDPSGGSLEELRYKKCPA